MHDATRFSCLAALAVLALSAAAGAQPKPQQAETKFQDGKRDFEAGNYAQACGELAESDQLDPAIGTLGLLAACHEKQGKTASAWREYVETAERAKRAKDPREAYARERATALEPLVPSLTLRSLGKEQGLEVTRNGEPVAQLGGDAQLDPGAYEIVAKAPGRKEYRASVTLKAHEHLVVDLPRLESGEPGAALGAQRGPMPVGTAAEGDHGPPHDGGGNISSSRKTLAYVAGGVGVVGLGVGAAFGFMAISKNNEAKDQKALCAKLTAGMDCGAKSKGAQATDAARSRALVSDIGFGVGVVGLAAGIVLLVTAPKEAPANDSASVAFVPGLGGGSVVGHF